MCDKLDKARGILTEVNLSIHRIEKFSELISKVNSFSVFDMLWDNVPIAMFYKDTNNTIIKVNNHFITVCGEGCKKEDIEGKSADELASKEIAEKYARNDYDVITTGKPKLNIIEPMLSYENKLFRTDKYPIKVEGNTIGVLGISVELQSN